MFFPLGMVLQFVLLVGLGLLLAPITVLATDMQRVVRIVLRFLFYLSPVLYGTHAVPEKLRAVLAFNPLNGILSLYRGGLFARGVSWVDVGYQRRGHHRAARRGLLDVREARAHRAEGDLSR